MEKTKTEPVELSQQPIRGSQFGKDTRKDRKGGASKRQNEARQEKTSRHSSRKGKSSREFHRNWDPNDPDQRVLGTQFWDAIPIMPVEVVLRTKYSQHLFRRIRNQFAVNCYLAEMMPAIETWKYWQDITEAVSTILDRAFEHVDAVFKESEEQTKHMIGLLGIKDMPHYMNTQQVKYAATTPRVKSFIRMLERLDEQVLRLDALWMAEGGIEHKYALTESMRLRKQLAKVSTHIYRQSDRVRRVLRGHLTHHSMLLEVQDDLSKHFGAGLRNRDDSGESMLLPGEDELSGELVGTTNEKGPGGETTDKADPQTEEEIPEGGESADAANRAAAS